MYEFFLALDFPTIPWLLYYLIRPGDLTIELSVAKKSNFDGTGGAKESRPTSRLDIPLNGCWPLLFDKSENSRAMRSLEGVVIRSGTAISLYCEVSRYIACI